MEHEKKINYIACFLNTHCEACFFFVFVQQRGSVLVEATFVIAYGLGSIISFICSDFPFTSILSDAVNGSLPKYATNNDSLYHLKVYCTTEIESFYVPNDIGSEKFCRWLVIKWRFKFNFIIISLKST
jgi:hypothetical protein